MRPSLHSAAVRSSATVTTYSAGAGRSGASCCAEEGREGVRRGEDQAPVAVRRRGGGGGEGRPVKNRGPQTHRTLSHLCHTLCVPLSPRHLAKLYHIAPHLHTSDTSPVSHTSTSTPPHLYSPVGHQQARAQAPDEPEDHFPYGKRHKHWKQQLHRTHGCDGDGAA